MQILLDFCILEIKALIFDQLKLFEFLFYLFLIITISIFLQKLSKTYQLSYQKAEYKWKKILPLPQRIQ